MENSREASGPSQHAVEIGVAAFTALFALIVIAGSLQAGIGWGAEGPKAGFFPFYVGVAILIASAVNLFQVGRDSSAGQLFAEWGHLTQVMAMLVPTALYVALIPWIGIYVASALLIAVFMRWLGRYSWGIVVAVAVGVPFATFLVFEQWFLLPLPKGPIEAYLGY
ncbi:MAG TPA: tripartite tricarboxylate transporter TctB family protein [Xanthobacteraceae bacterium]